VSFAVICIGYTRVGICEHEVVRAQFTLIYIGAAEGTAIGDYLMAEVMF